MREHSIDRIKALAQRAADRAADRRRANIAESQVATVAKTSVSRLRRRQGYRPSQFLAGHVERLKTNSRQPTHRSHQNRDRRAPNRREKHHHDGGHVRDRNPVDDGNVGAIDDRDAQDASGC